MVNTLKGILNALDGVEVKGEENLDRILGSIRALKTVITAMESKPKGGEKDG